jgi:hypothetical protein
VLRILPRFFSIFTDRSREVDVQSLQAMRPGNVFAVADPLTNDVNRSTSRPTHGLMAIMEALMRRMKNKRPYVSIG